MRYYSDNPSMDCEQFISSDGRLWMMRTYWHETKTETVDITKNPFHAEVEKKQRADNVKLSDSRLRSFFGLGAKRGWYVDRAETPLRTTFIGGHDSGITFTIDLSDGVVTLSEAPCTVVKGVDMEGYLHVAVNADGERERLALIAMLTRCGLKPNAKPLDIPNSDLKFRPHYRKKNGNVYDAVHGPKAGTGCTAATFKRKPGKGARNKKPVAGLVKPTRETRVVSTGPIYRNLYTGETLPVAKPQPLFAGLMKDCPKALPLPDGVS